VVPASGATHALAGVIPVLAMPFTPDGSVDQSALRAQAGWAIGAGVDGLALALASELPRLSERERSEVCEAVVEEAAGRVPVVVHAGAESDALAIALARDAERRGAAAVMVPAPRFEVGGAAAVSGFFRRVLEATGADLVIQDIPEARASASLAAELAREFPGRVALKVEVPPTPIAVRDAVQESGGTVPVFGGAGGLVFISELLRGATGTMPGCVVPEVFVATWRRFRAGDVDGARAAFAAALPFLVATTQPGRLLPLYREALAVRGVIPAAHGRCPDGELDDTDRAEVRALLAGLL
jgi:2-keto-3-deoxy-L-arabinonate dehydratase